MREIKFRAWHKRRKKYEYWEFGSGGSNPPIMLNRVGYQYPLEQFTGLKDKNGKEIYRNDGFERNGHKGFVDQVSSGLWIVVFDGKTITLESDPLWDWKCEEQELISTIH